MGIEARGAKLPFAVVHHAHIETHDARHNAHVSCFDAADSMEEALERAARRSLVIFPESDGWLNHFESVILVSDIDWIAPIDENQVKPQPLPWSTP